MNEGWLYIDPKMKTSAWVDEIINTLIHTVNKIRFIAQNCVRIYKLPKELSQE